MIYRVADATSDIADSDHGYEQIFTVYIAMSLTAYSVLEETNVKGTCVPSAVQALTERKTSL